MPRPAKTRLEQPGFKHKFYGSMKQAAAMGFLTVEILSKLKAEGCDGFDAAGRVHTGKVQAWMDAHKDSLEKYDPDETPLKDQKLKEEIRKLRILNDTKEGKLIARQVVADTSGEYVYKLKGILYQKLENEWPSQLAGLDVVELRRAGKDLADQLLRDIQNLAEIWKGK